MANVYRLKVDLKLKQSGIVPTFVQYDTAKLEFQIFDNGKVFDLTGYTTVEFAHKKPDGSVIVGSGAIETDDKGNKIVVYNYQGSEMNKEGVVETSFSLIGANNKKISIQTFKVKIVKDLRDGIVDPANPEYSKLQEYSIQIEGIIAQADEATNNAKEMKFVNAYNIATAYKKNNTITYNGESYIAKQANTNKPPTGLANDPNWAILARKGQDGTGTVQRHREEFISTADQKIFTLSKSYDQFQNRIDVEVGGVPQFSPDNFTESSSTTITLSEGIPAGIKVIVTYFSQAIPLGTDLDAKVNSHTTQLNANNNLLVQHSDTLVKVNQQLAEKLNRDAKGVLDLNIFNEPTRAAIQGIAPGTINAVLGAGNVKPENTSFFETGKNLFNKETANLDRAVSSSSGILTVSEEYHTTDYMPVFSGQQYSASYDNRIAFYDANKVFISGAITMPSPLTIPSGAVFVRQSFLKSMLNTFQFEKGAAKTTYEPYLYKLNKRFYEIPSYEIGKGVIKPENTTFFKAGKNLFNKETVNLDTAVSSASGILTASADYHTTDFIEVVAGQQYSSNYDNRTAFYDKNKNFISGEINIVSPFTVPVGAVFVRRSLLKTLLDTYQLEKGSIKTNFEPYNYKLKDSFFEIPKNSIEIDQLKDGLNGLIENGKNKLNRNAEGFRVGFTITSLGGLFASAEYQTTDFIGVGAGKTIKYSYAKRDIAPRQVAAYDINKTFIARETLPTNYVTPPNTAFVRISDKDLLHETAQIEIGQAVTTFEPYGYRVNAVNLLGASGGNSPLPLYIADEIKRVSQKVIAKKSDLTFSFATDIHNSQYQEDEYKLKIIGELGKTGILNFAALGGDVVDGGENTPLMKERLTRVLMGAKDSFPTDLFICRGNHDTGWDYFPTDVIKPWEWHNMACNHLEGKVVFDDQNTTGGYYYKDYSKSKTRVIVMNTSDFYELDASGQPVLNPLAVHLRQKQFEWLQRKALNFMDKGEERTGWAIVVLSHAPMNPIETGGLNGRQLMEDVFNAFMTGTAFTGVEGVGTNKALSANVDFTEQGGLEFICQINGHMHYDKVSIFPKLNRPAITVGNAKTGVDYKVSPMHPDATVWTTRTRGTISAELFDIFSIDREARKISTTRFGTGADREINY